MAPNMKRLKWTKNVQTAPQFTHPCNLSMEIIHSNRTVTGFDGGRGIGSCFSQWCLHSNSFYTQNVALRHIWNSPSTQFCRRYFNANCRQSCAEDLIQTYLSDFSASLLFPQTFICTMFRELIRIHFITTPFQLNVRVCVALKSIAGNIRASAAALSDLTEIIQMSADVPLSFPAKSKARHSYQVKLRRFSPHNGHSRIFIAVGPTNHSASYVRASSKAAWFTFQTTRRQREWNHLREALGQTQSMVRFGGVFNRILIYLKCVRLCVAHSTILRRCVSV